MIALFVQKPPFINGKEMIGNYSRFWESFACEVCWGMWRSEGAQERCE